MKTIFAVFFAAAAAGCQSDISSDYYRATSVGNVNRAVRGVLINVRAVKVADESGIGASSAAASGAIGGATASDNAAGAAVLAIAGAVAGGVVGHAAEKSLTKQDAFEYVVEAENGALLTLVQGGPDRFVTGEAVLVIYGSPSRIVKAQTAAAPKK